LGKGDVRKVVEVLLIEISTEANVPREAAIGQGSKSLQARTQQANVPR